MAMFVMAAGVALSAYSSYKSGQDAKDASREDAQSIREAAAYNSAMSIYESKISYGNAELVEENSIEDKRRVYEAGSAAEAGFRKTSRARQGTNIHNVAKSDRKTHV